MGSRRPKRRSADRSFAVCPVCFKEFTNYGHHGAEELETMVLQHVVQCSARAPNPQPRKVTVEEGKKRSMPQPGNAISGVSSTLTTEPMLKPSHSVGPDDSAKQANLFVPTKSLDSTFKSKLPESSFKLNQLDLGGLKKTAETSSNSKMPGARLSKSGLKSKLPNQISSKESKALPFDKTSQKKLSQGQHEESTVATTSPSTSSSAADDNEAEAVNSSPPQERPFQLLIPSELGPDHILNQTWWKKKRQRKKYAVFPSHFDLQKCANVSKPAAASSTAHALTTECPNTQSIKATQANAPARKLRSRPQNDVKFSCPYCKRDFASFNVITEDSMSRHVAKCSRKHAFTDFVSLTCLGDDEKKEITKKAPTVKRKSLKFMLKGEGKRALRHLVLHGPPRRKRKKS